MARLPFDRRPLQEAGSRWLADPRVSSILLLAALSVLLAVWLMATGALTGIPEA